MNLVQIAALVSVIAMIASIYFAWRTRVYATTPTPGRGKWKSVRTPQQGSVVIDDLNSYLSNPAPRLTSLEQ